MGNELVVPFTGEIVDLDDPMTCARMLQEIREITDQLRDARAVLTDSLLRESERQGTKTLRFGSIEARINTPMETVWDYGVLLELRDAGLPEERFDELVTTNVEYKVNGLIAKSIASSNQTYKEIIDRARSQHPRSPSVTVTKGKIE